MFATAIRPEPTEYVSYFGRYIDLVPGDDVMASLKNQLESTPKFLKSIPESRGHFRYAPGKWSIKEVIGHIIDTEKIMAYRALRFGRSDQTPVAGFEQDDYVKGASFDEYRLEDLIAELECVRRASIYFFQGLPEAAWLRKGSASKNDITVRALAYVIAGHELHHLAFLKSHYLK